MSTTYEVRFRCAFDTATTPPSLFYVPISQVTTVGSFYRFLGSGNITCMEPITGNPSRAQISWEVVDYDAEQALTYLSIEDAGLLIGAVILTWSVAYLWKRVIRAFGYH